MTLSKPVDWVDRPFEGYVVNAEFSKENSITIEGLMGSIKQEFGELLFFPPIESMHVTLLDWIAPLIDYDGRSKSELYAQVKEDYDDKLIKAVAGIGEIDIIFDDVKVTDSTIIILGHDSGQFQKIRDAFVESVDLIPGTKMPPNIIHSSIARFVKTTEIEPIQNFIRNKPIVFTEKIRSFRLIHSVHEPLIKYEVLKRYNL